MNVKSTVTHVPHRYATKVQVGVMPAGTQGPQINKVHNMGSNTGANFEEQLNRYRAFVNELRVDMQTPAVAIQDKYLVGEYNRLLEVVGRNRTYTAETVAEALGMCGNVLAIAISVATRRHLLKISDEIAAFSTIAVGAGNVSTCEEVLDAAIAWLNDVGFVLPSHMDFLKKRLGWAKDSEIGKWEDEMIFVNNVVGTIINDTEIATDTSLKALQDAWYDADATILQCMRDISAYVKTRKISSYEELVANKLSVDDFQFYTLTTGGWGGTQVKKIGNLSGYQYSHPAPRNFSYNDDTYLAILIRQKDRDKGIDPLDYVCFDATVAKGLVNPGRQTIILTGTLLRSHGDPDETTIFGSCKIGSFLTNLANNNENLEFDRFTALQNYLDFFAGYAFNIDADGDDSDVVIHIEPFGYDTVLYKKDSFDLQVRTEGFKALAYFEFETKTDGAKKEQNNNKFASTPKKENESIPKK